MWLLRQLASRRRRRYEDLTISIEEHLAEKIEELTENGMSEKGAKDRAAGVREI